MRKGEHFYPFGVSEDETQRIPAGTSADGYLELHVIEGGPVYLIRGDRDATQFAASTDSGTPDSVNFDLAATVESPGVVRLESGAGGFTVFSRADSVGYLRWVSC